MRQPHTHHAQAYKDAAFVDVSTAAEQLRPSALSALRLANQRHEITGESKGGLVKWSFKRYVNVNYARQEQQGNGDMLCFVGLQT